MLHFNTKKYEIVFLIIFTVLSFFSIQNFSLTKDKDELLQETTTTPSSGKVVILDAGHGGEDGGAVSESGISEADLNLQITLKVQELLERLLF